MRLQKKIIYGIILCLLLITIVFINIWVINIYSKKTLLKFTKTIEQGNLDDLTLTIYYKNPFILTAIPLTVDAMINGSNDYKIIVDSNQLKNHINLLKNINEKAISQVEQDSYFDIRIYYVFESKKSGMILDVAMWGANDSYILVNGIAVKGNDVFYDILTPFLPEDEVNDFLRYSKK